MQLALSLLLALIAWFTNSMRAKANTERQAMLLEMLRDLVFDVVKKAMQTSVSAARRTGVWGKDSAEAAKRAVLAEVKSVGASMLASLIATGFNGNVEQMLESMLESAVRDVKAGDA